MVEVPKSVLVVHRPTAGLPYGAAMHFTQTMANQGANMTIRGVHPAPSETHVPIGARLRASRKRQGLTIDELATATNLTKGFLSRVERDLTSPSVSTLATICQVLSLSIGQLFEEPAVQVLRYDEAPLINLGVHGATERLVTPRDQRQAQMIVSELQEGASAGEKLYTINCQIEIVHVVEGHVVVQLADREIELFAGDTLTLPGSEPHTWRATMESRATWTLVPAPWSSAVPQLLTS